MGLSINRSSDNKTIVVTVGQRFDFSLHREFRDIYKDEPENMEYIIDMHNTEYMDSSALGMLLILREHSGETANRVTLKGCQHSIRQILEISNFTKLFKVV